jgi:transcriptional regulator with XRE-family HTH domain
MKQPFLGDTKQQKHLPSKGRLVLFALGYTQKQLAEKAGVDPAYVSRCLRGLQKPSDKFIKAALAFVGAEAVKTLFEGLEDSPNE